MPKKEIRSKLVGVSGDESQKAIEHFGKTGQKLFLYHDRWNKEDKNTVFVSIPIRIGQLDKKTAAEIAPLLDRGTRVTAVISEVDKEVTVRFVYEE